MASVNQLRGALLEEAILYLLRRSGYDPVMDAGTDPTVYEHGMALYVRGRGSNHQVDAIADYSLPMPFTPPQRLLVEAKAYTRGYPIGLPIIRNAVGVLKDVREFWTGTPVQCVGEGYYHYQYALFSTCRFSTPAQKYAFAQGIYLLPLADSVFFRPILEALDEVTVGAPRLMGPRGIGETRRAFRAWWTQRYYDLREDGAVLRPLFRACAEVGNALLAMIANWFPVFLVPSPELRIEDLRTHVPVRIYWDDTSWYLELRDGRRVFSFDLPPDLFLLYSEQGHLSPEKALDLKSDFLREIKAIHLSEQGVGRLITFSLDMDWLETLRVGLQRRVREQDHRDD